jgi:hypothetical protein
MRAYRRQRLAASVLAVDAEHPSTQRVREFPFGENLALGLQANVSNTDMEAHLLAAALVTAYCASHPHAIALQGQVRWR